ncbi:hypothetical protein [Streptomyces melanogenes]|uniref:hypothetical protein n=1 Tax=Streptomyces melanogenes TaxID=67326 RepID=UPI00167C563C|nr:hypothetical protein [Streptomyces melanogenes]GGP89987.1 hypothetical protein GCM10010278_80510 [Streptomyces melanogenes]
MAAKKDPAVRRAREAARRAAAVERIGPQPVRTPRPRTLYSMRPPGLYYEDWHAPKGEDNRLINEIVDKFGPDSDEAKTMRIMLEYRTMYGPRFPFAAAGHLDVILNTSELTAQLTEPLNCSPEEARQSLHSLHAQGLLLVADDGSLWTTVPPGTPLSAADGQWAFVEKKADAPAG